MIRIGIIGAGPNAAGNASNFAQLKDRCRVAAVADPNFPRAEALAQEFGAAAHEQFESFLDSVDAVAICSPNFLHPQQALMCAAAGKHIFCEKPVALTGVEALEMAAAAEKADLGTVVAFSVRFEPVFIAMRTVLESEALGEPISAWSRRLFYFDPAVQPAWRLDPKLSGGVLSELCAHELDWIISFLGRPSAVFARKQCHASLAADPRANDHIWVSLDLPGGLTATLECSQMSPMPEFYRGILGRKAGVYTNKWGNEPQLIRLGGGNPEPLELPGGFNKHAHFLDVVEKRTRSVADLRYGAELAVLTDLILESCRTGQVMPVPGPGAGSSQP